LTQNKVNFKFGLLAVVLIAALLTVAASTTLQHVSAQNSSNSSNPKVVQNSSSSKNASSNAATSKPNKTTTTAIIVAGAKSSIAKASATATARSYNRTGFTNLNVLTINGKNYPIKYSIKGGKLVGMLADTDRSTLVLVLNPGKNGGNMTIELPRNVIDSKGASNGDTKYQVKIDGKGVDYKEVANDAYARVLLINFSKDNRFMEIIGTKMVS
jgi:hypothetical protein